MGDDIRKYTRDRISKMNYYSALVRVCKLEDFLEQFPVEEREIGVYLYKRLQSYPDLVERYKETKSLIEKILKSLGYDDRYIKSYLNKHKTMLLQTTEEIYARLAILSLVGIDERMAMQDGLLITNYNDSIIYLAAKAVKKEKERLYVLWQNERAVKEVERAMREVEALKNGYVAQEDEEEEDQVFDPRVYPEDVRNYICNNELNVTRLTSLTIDTLTRRYVQSKSFK